MKRTFALCFLLVACGGEPIDADEPAHAPSLDYDIQSAGLTAARTPELLGDIAEFVRDGFGARLGTSGFGTGGFSLFSTNARCQRSITFGGESLTLEHDCTTPAGRRVRGSLSIDLDAAQCSAKGLEVEIHLAVQDQPGGDHELLVDGRVALGLDARRMFFAVSLEHERTWQSHSVRRSIDSCFILDGADRLVAMNGHVRTEVDGAVLHNLEIRDLQHSLCHPLPASGTVLAETMHGRVEITFDRDTPDTSQVTVVAEHGASRVELEATTPVRFCDAPTAPVAIDYAVCERCGPAPNPGGGTQTPPGGGGSSEPPEFLPPPDV